MSKLLITGCAGFIGWNVTELALRDSNVVIGIDNLNDAYDVRLKEWRLHQLRDKPNWTFYRIDISNQSEVAGVFKEHQGRESFDAVINLAARAGVQQSTKDPCEYYDTNLTGTLNLLELCRKFEVKKIILASTSSIYGEMKRPFREDQSTDTPLSPYAASKKAAEVLCYTYHYLYNLDITILRYFTVYGPAGRPDMNIFRFIKQVAEGSPVFIYGDGTQERDFTYVDDIAMGTLSALKLMGYEIINLGSDRPIKLLKVLHLIEQFVERQAEVKYKPRHPADVPATWADISRARKLLSWKPQVTLEEGIHKAVGWYMENRNWAKDILIEE
ncbi:MAG: UDP-glucose 4-epimerase [Firmicutes bacterium]|nr:UDP-glucose 4-epimerase [Bacillota bacterium]